MTLGTNAFWVDGKFEEVWTKAAETGSAIDGALP